MVSRKTILQSLPEIDEASHAAEPAFHELDASLLALKQTLFESGANFPPEEFILRVNLWDEGDDPKNGRNLFIKIPSLSFISAIRFAERSAQQGWDLLQIGGAQAQAQAQPQAPVAPQPAPGPPARPATLPRAEPFATFEGTEPLPVEEAVADELYLARPFLEFGFGEEKT